MELESNEVSVTWQISAAIKYVLPRTILYDEGFGDPEDYKMDTLQ